MTKRNSDHLKTITPPKTEERILCSYDKVGAIILTGCYGGAFSWHMRCTRIEGELGQKGSRAHYERVEAKSVRNTDGTFSTVYETVI